MFSGFTPRSFDILFEIALHNDRTWFLEHKEEFEQVLNRPFRALGEEMAARMQARFPARDLRPHIARIYRDARRLYGRGPYKDHLWFSLQRGNTKAHGPMLWFEINPDGVSHGMGMWDRTPEQAALFRRKIAAHPARFEQLVLSLPAQERGRLWGEEYKRPKGHVSPLIDPWYNRRSLSFGYENLFGDAVYSPELPALLESSFTALLPLLDFFQEAADLAQEKTESD